MWNYRMFIPWDAVDECGVHARLSLLMSSTNQSYCWGHAPESICLSIYTRERVQLGEEYFLEVDLTIRLYNDRTFPRQICDWSFIEAHAVPLGRLQ